MELTISLPEGPQRMGVTGSAERNLKIIRESLGVVVTFRAGTLRLSGESKAVGQAAHVLQQLSEAARRHRPLQREQVLELVVAASQHDPAAQGSLDDTDGEDLATAALRKGMDVYLPGRRIRPSTEGQKRYVAAVMQHDLTFCIGPAGTGKTYLAVAAAVSFLKQGLVRKLVLVRPAVEAGERLGFLPGTLQEKVNPYLRPLLDGLHDMMEFEQVQRFIDSDIIEIVPLAFMRGRTLNDAMVILDEAQNTTRSQMLMFLTRMGHGSKMVVTGDATQIDLDDPRESGLVDAARRLRRVPGIAFANLSDQDIVRHNLVQRIVNAYEASDARRPAATHMPDTPSENDHQSPDRDDQGDP